MQNQAPKERQFPSFRFSPASCSAVSSRGHDEDTAPSASLTPLLLSPPLLLATVL
jgi:hypothetical protein